MVCSRSLIFESNSGRTITELNAGYNHVCAIPDNSTTKCWGRNNSGQLGIGNTTAKGTRCWGSGSNGALLNANTASTLGSVPGDLGDGLPWVNH